ncbi:uncharacterized protein NPIL_470031 [Nephila pilipes]|uniref:Uncharacterized protein n=1 Tax=Nephila pilipes TaxID=299642 RepID=A0A8X6NGL1_NEPPI|nr:uncharacterized protein NPIL_470031 [Nephila pilipes]
MIDDYVKDGIVERTSCDSLLNCQGFYIPYHAVISHDKMANRLRIVFYDSAHEDGYSLLNKSLYMGSNLPRNILELILRFKENPVALTTDVKSAFLQIERDFPDRSFTRFYWSSEDNDPYVLNYRRILFGPSKVLGLS